MIILVRREVPPKLRNGRAIPLVGNRPVTTQRFIRICIPIKREIPAERYPSKEPQWCLTILKHLHRSNTKTRVTETAPAKPVSSPTTANITSVCASGRKKSFCRPSPIPVPSRPPSPKERKDCTIWYPAVEACSQG